MKKQIKVAIAAKGWNRVIIFFQLVDVASDVLFWGKSELRINSAKL